MPRVAVRRKSCGGGGFETNVETIGLVQILQLLVILGMALVALWAGVAALRGAGAGAKVLVLEPAAGPVIAAVKLIRPRVELAADAPCRAPPGQEARWLVNAAQTPHWVR